MFDVQCDMYAGGQLMASDVKVWLHPKEATAHSGMFHIPSNLEVLTGAKYHLELVGERARLLDMPVGHTMNVVITEVAGEIAHFMPLTAGSMAHTT
jgi:hypothetical protein